MDTNQPDREHEIANLIEELRKQGIRDERVLTAIRTVPRERFVSEELRDQAWANRALPIGSGQTISQPLIVAVMTEALALLGNETVLEIGAGSGYQAAILSRLAKRVVSVERVPELAALARERLSQHGYDNVDVVVGDGSEGWPVAGPVDRIIVTAAAPSIPEKLLRTLHENGGRLVIPVGDTEDQHLVLIERQGHRISRRSLGGVKFVPLVGRGGWQSTSGEN